MLVFGNTTVGVEILPSKIRGRAVWKWVGSSTVSEFMSVREACIAGMRAYHRKMKRAAIAAAKEE